MSTNLTLIDTIFIVLMENRSFDQMLGYLSLPEYGRFNIEGLRKNTAYDPPLWQPGFIIPPGSQPFPMADPRAPLPGHFDPPHERTDIQIQLGTSQTDSSGKLIYPMDGFVKSFPETISLYNADWPVVMGYFTGEELPTNDFFAQNFSVCDHWFAALPAGTQPNRLMAMSGISRIDTNVSGRLPEQKLVYDWLSEKGVSWRVYHEGLPFFMLMPSCLAKVFDDDKFRDFDRLAKDIQNETDISFPRVIFVEPRYTNAPHIDSPHDDHSPTAVDGGQRFLMEVYAALTANPTRWKKSVMIVTYDEHGGYFDHVSPPRIPTPAPSGEYPPFASTGVRVPAFVISPFVEPGSVFKDDLDHTSILQLLGEKFGGGYYSDEVEARKAAGLKSVSMVLTLAEARAEVPPPPELSPGFTPQRGVYDTMSAAFAAAWSDMQQQYPDKTPEKFPKLAGHFPEAGKPASNGD